MNILYRFSVVFVGVGTTSNNGRQDLAGTCALCLDIGKSCFNASSTCFNDLVHVWENESRCNQNFRKHLF